MEIGQFASKTFEFRDQLHIAHLITKSYAEHKALGSLYEYIGDFADTFLETYKGFTNELSFDTITVEQSKLTNPIFIIEDYIAQVLLEAKNDMAQDMTTYGFLVNMLEEAMAESYRTIYKLKNLK